MPTSIPLTGAQYEISAGGYRAIITELGAGLRQFTHGDQPVISDYGPDELPPAGAGQLLTPWPNRIDGGRYRFAGMDCQLDLSEPAQGNAIHGLTRWAGWQAGQHDADRVVLRHVLHGRSGYPFCLDLTAEYLLTAGEGLRVTVTARNPGSRPAPYGTGSHPYLTAGTPVIDECSLELPAARWLPAGPRGIPVTAPQDVTGTQYDFRVPRKLAATVLDHAFTDLSRDGDGLAWVRLEGGGARTGLWMDASYGWLQVFTSDSLEPGRYRAAVAVEPMTCPPNAFASGSDRIRLAPGDSVTHRWGLRSE